MLDQRDWRAPDWIVLPGGNLGNTSAFGKALREARELGLIDRMPRLAVVQAEGAAPFHEFIAPATRSPYGPGLAGAVQHKQIGWQLLGAG